MFRLKEFHCVCVRVLLKNTGICYGIVKQIFQYSVMIILKHNIVKSELLLQGSQLA